MHVKFPMDIKVWSGAERSEQAEHQQQDEHRQQAHTTGQVHNDGVQVFKAVFQYSLPPQVSKQGPTERIKGREREADSSPAQRQVRPDVRQGGDCRGEIFDPRSNSSSSTICVHSASTCCCWFLVNLAKNLSEVLILGT